MKITYSQSVADAAVLSTKITQKSGVFSVAFTTAAGVHHSAIYTLYDSAGTPTTVVLSGNGTYFSITKTTESKINVYWETDQVKIENQTGETLAVKVEGEFYSN
jgi:hypothetical protein